jgi:uncharacterized membrane protein
MAEQKSRYVYIDLLRGWAVLVMIEVHVFNTFLLEQYRHAAWFPVLNFINGLVAPSFLFIAGYAFAVIGQRKWEDYLAFGPVFRKQVMRVLQVWIVGYMLHIPFFSLRRLLVSAAADWHSFWLVDVLHCIAFSLMLMLALVLIGRTKKAFFVQLLVVGLSAAIITPILWFTTPLSVLPFPLATYINATLGSLFPIFPWMGFALLGGATGQWMVWMKARDEEKKFFLRVLYGGAAMTAGSVLVQSLPVVLPWPHDLISPNPVFFVLRLGIVLILLSTLWFWEQTAKSGRSVVSVVGMESLVVYSGHLLIIYGLFFKGKSLSFMIGRTRSVPEAAAMTAVLVGVMIVTAYVWNWVKSKGMTYARVVQYTLLAVAILVFALKEW